MKLFSKYIDKALLTLGIAWVLICARSELYSIAWGTGIWRGEFSRTWAFFYYGFCFFCIGFFVVALLYFWKRDTLAFLIDPMVSLRQRLGWARWLLVLPVLIFPVWFLQYTPWGLVFHQVYIRILIWLFMVLVVAFLMMEGKVLFGWMEFIVAVLITSAEFVMIVPFIDVSNYPFSLGWSEGNRLWDYSILFGRHLYDYPADKNVYVFLDMGRRFVGGLPFILPGLTIGMERFWVGLTIVLPYVFLGFAAFRSVRKDWSIYILTVLWSLIFLKQGPIHPPLVLCAVAVALIWRSPLWLAIPLIAITGYAAEESRFTWLLAPGMWIGMLELAGAELQNGKLSLNAWIRAISLGLIGMAGGVFWPKVAGLFAGNVASAPTTAVTVERVTYAATAQPLLWYRLFPNATYGQGVLIGLLIAVLPLIIFLFYLVVSGKWKLNIWQALAIISPLLAFLIVGLIISTKIGGGGDLHNMDMFLIGLFFATVIAWEKGGKSWFTNPDLSPAGLKLLILLLFAFPALQSLREMRTQEYVENTPWLATLTDTKEADIDKFDLKPSPEITEKSLKTIQEEVALARSRGGDVLFLDQRQLLTFGFIKNVPLVPEYEKKFLMNEALESKPDYFKLYYEDLAAKRFALIVSEPLRAPVKDSSFQFGEENNAWVEWVSIPTLCYYEPKVTLKEVGVQLLVPRTETTECESLLPDGVIP